LKIKSKCCSEILLLSLSDALPILEDKIGFKCDESFLEDSALRLLKISLNKKSCGCPPYKYIMADLDDPTIIVQRFMGNVTTLCKEKEITITVYACSGRDPQKFQK
jgi:hypothetical protein